jgi:hypothetical protein
VYIILMLNILCTTFILKPTFNAPPLIQQVTLPEDGATEHRNMSQY